MGDRTLRVNATLLTRLTSRYPVVGRGDRVVAPSDPAGRAIAVNRVLVVAKAATTHTFVAAEAGAAWVGR